MAGIRIGHGYDVHRLETGRRLVLGGVEIPFEKGLSGHSDADVLVHAIMDAMLGAAALGDIGKHFSDTDPAHENADSLRFLSRVAEIVAGNGYALGNLDATVLAEKPKLAPYIFEIRKKLAAVLGVDAGKISVKATTEEGLGFTGAGQGIAAHAVVLLEQTT